MIRGDSPRTRVEMEIYEVDFTINAALYQTAFRAMGPCALSTRIVRDRILRLTVAALRFLRDGFVSKRLSGGGSGDGSGDRGGGAAISSPLSFARVQRSTSPESWEQSTR